MFFRCLQALCHQIKNDRIFRHDAFCLELCDLISELRQILLMCNQQFIKNSCL